MNVIGKLSAVLAGAAVACAVVPGSASAATLSLVSTQRVNTTGSTPPVDLTAQGNLDWAYWNIIGTGANPLPPTNEKATGVLIGSLSATGGGGVRGPGASTTITTQNYSFSDGTSPTTATNVTLGGLAFNTNLGASAVGKGVSLSIVGTPAADEFVTLYFGGFGAVGTLTATLAGATTVTQPSQAFATGDKQLEVYTLRFRPDSLTDTLTVNYSTASTSDANGHVGVQAVTVSNVPEPAAVGLGGAAVAGLLVRRSRRRACGRA
jgi:hypothetical protein